MNLYIGNPAVDWETTVLRWLIGTVVSAAFISGFILGAILF